MTHLSLFTGIGGLDLAAEMAGIETVGQCEWADYPTKVLEKHWPDVPRWRDIRMLTKESFYERTGLRTVDIISGGFPCQPFSVAGERRGAEDDRYLWPEMCRVIRELQPAWVLGENVPGIVNMALDTVLADLEDLGYATQPFIIPACGVDAPHRRYRVAILAHSEGLGCGHGNDGENARETDREVNTSSDSGLLRGERSDSDAESIRSQSGAAESLLLTRERERERRRIPSATLRTCGSHAAWENWPLEPDVGRVADGIPNRVDRIRCLGNAVVPQQFYPFFQLIADIERGET